jgi:hypothetical protein
MQIHYEKAVTFVDSAFRGKVPHFERTVFWFERLAPRTTEAHRIAAYAHDIDRAFNPANATPENYRDPAFLTRHQDEGARIMAEFLEEEGALEPMIETVVRMISHHEIGGDAEQNLLRDADSVSFFETSTDLFVRSKAPVEGYEKIRSKLDWMFERIGGAEARRLAAQNYRRAIADLDELFGQPAI